MPAVYVGASGWTYAVWRHGFFAGVPQRRWLEHYAGAFDAVEVNATFYRLLPRRTFEGWRERTPPGFRFAIKGSRAITHLSRLREPDARVQLDRERALGLGDKLAAVLWQLPASLHKDPERLRRFAAALDAWPEARHAIEFRHQSWFDEETASLLAEHRLAVCLSDAPTFPMWPRTTTDLVYVRLHGHEEIYRSPYSDDQLRHWATLARDWLAEGRDVHIYLDNTDAGAAPADAARLRAMLGAV